ncbi:hypothetical protein [uncultured Arthrobacter sp.]|uniref:hypothetical protein n=1 Tax=uncultured Arthrobacter sp. TaxID=114050 RepID=UPI0026111E14|nr:hypothetical protein [uncultured Arthrobacter sp.]
MIELPVSNGKQRAAWEALFEIYGALPEGWVLAGGQAVYLHAIERNAGVVRPTEDADTVLDIRNSQGMLQTFTAKLLELGFESSGESPAGHQHRWTRGHAMIDVLIPRFTGERSEKRPGATGGTTIAAPAGQTAVSRSETVEVSVTGESFGFVNRTTLLGSLIGKSAALQIVDDPKWKRHVTDFLVLASVLRRTDLRGSELGRAEKKHLANMLGLLARNPAWLAGEEDAARGVERLRLFLSPKPVGA